MALRGADVIDQSANSPSIKKTTAASNSTKPMTTKYVHAPSKPNCLTASVIQPYQLTARSLGA